MPSQVRDLPNMVPTSSGSVNGTAWGHLDDASSITIYGSTNGASTQLQVQVSQFDPADIFPAGSGITQSSQFYPLMANGTSSGFVFVQNGEALVLSPISYRGIRLISTGADAAATIIAFGSKQISVAIAGLALFAATIPYLV